MASIAIETRPRCVGASSRKRRGTSQRTRSDSAPTSALTRVHWAAIGLAGITGIVHLYLYRTQSFIPFPLAGLGFLTVAGLMGTPFDYRLLSLGGISFTAMQVAAWIQLEMPDFALGVVDKTI